MRKSADTDEVAEFFRFRIVEHLAGERRAEFRNAERAGCSAEFLRCNAERFRRGEYAHCRRVVERNAARVAVRDIFQHFDYGRVIMAEYVEFNKTAADGMVIEMRRYRIGVVVVGRALYRREMVYVHIARDNHDAARVLAGGAFYAGAAVNEAVYIGIAFFDAFFVEEFFYVAVSRFVGDGGNRSGAEYIVLAEQFFRVFVGDRLIIAGEVQVDIGNFVAVKAHKYGKRNIVAVFYHFRAAVRTVFIRHVETAAVSAVFDKFAVLAVRTAPMRRQRIYFRNACHGGDEGRADRTSRAYKIAVVERFFYKLMRNQIQYGEAVPDNGVELQLQTVLHDFRQIFAVQFARFGV